MRRVVLLSIAMVAGCGSSASEQGTGAPSPGASSGSSGSPSANASASCDAPSADVAVSQADAAGYPSYAVSGCSLVYASPAGVLVFRDLATGAEEELSGYHEAAKRPSASSEVIAWEAEDGGPSSVVVRVRATGETKTIRGAFVAASEPRVSGTAVVFTAWVTETDADVWLYDAITGETQVVFSGPAQQRFADVSADYVVATDFSEDPDGMYDGQGGDLADIVVFDRRTRTATKRIAEKKQAFPMIVDGARLDYLEWSLVHPEPKLEGYAIRVGPIAGAAVEDQTVADVVLRTSYPVRPSTANGMIEWTANGDGVTALWRAPADRSQPPAKVAGIEGLQLAAPASAASFTVVMAAVGNESRLRTVGR